MLFITKNIFTLAPFFSIFNILSAWCVMRGSKCEPLSWITAFSKFWVAFWKAVHFHSLNECYNYTFSPVWKTKKSNFYLKTNSWIKSLYKHQGERDQVASWSKAPWSSSLAGISFSQLKLIHFIPTQLWCWCAKQQRGRSVYSQEQTISNLIPEFHLGNGEPSMLLESIPWFEHETYLLSFVLYFILSWCIP